MNLSKMDPCSQIRSALGVYVLGAIDPAGRSQVDAHLGTCPDCRDELAGLAGLPALLGRIGEPQITQVAGPSEELLESLLTKAADRSRDEQARAQWAELERTLAESRTRRARRWRLGSFVAAAAVVVLLAGVLLGGLLTGGGEGPYRGGGTPGPRVTSAAPSAPIADQVARTDPRTHVRAMIGLDGRKWGTALTVRIDGVPPGARCHLYAVARDGHRDVAAGWRTQAEEYGNFFGSTMIPRDQLLSLEVVTTDGRTLVRVPAAPGDRGSSGHLGPARESPASPGG